MTFMVILALTLSLYLIGYRAHQTANYRRELEMVLICIPLFFCLAWEARSFDHLQEWASIAISVMLFLQMFLGVIYATLIAYKIWSPQIHLSPQKDAHQT